MNTNLVNRRSFLAAAGAGLALPFLAEKQSAKAAVPQEATSSDDLDKLFAPIEKVSDQITTAQKQAASKALEAAINGADFLDGIKFDKAADGKFYPNLAKKDAMHIAKALKQFFKDAYAKDVDFNEAVSFIGAGIDPKSTFRNRSFFIADKPIADSAKDVSIHFGERLKDQVAKIIPDAPKDALAKLYKYFRDFTFTNLFLIAPGQHNAPEDWHDGKIKLDNVLKSPGGWHIFSKNGIRLDYVAKQDVTNDSPGSKKGSFAIRNSYNVSMSGKDGKDKMLTVAMGHNHAVIHQSAKIDSPDDNGGGNFFDQIMSLDPKGPVEGQRHLPYYNHETIPAKQATHFTGLAS